MARTSSHDQDQQKSTLCAIGTAGSPQDVGTVTIPGYLGKYAVRAVWARAISATGTLAAGTVDIRTAAAGGGVSVLAAPTALTGLTATDKVQNISASFADARTESTLYIRQTVNAGNSGVAQFTIDTIDLT